jgi:hypothetical protein
MRFMTIFFGTIMVGVAIGLIWIFNHAGLPGH